MLPPAPHRGPAPIEAGSGEGPGSRHLGPEAGGVRYHRASPLLHATTSSCRRGRIMPRPLAGIDDYPRTRLGHAPTPLDAAPNLGAALGIELWVKRDDCTGLAMGGNKVRQLEFYLGEAQVLRSPAPRPGVHGQGDGGPHCARARGEDRRGEPRALPPYRWAARYLRVRGQARSMYGVAFGERGAHFLCDELPVAILWAGSHTRGRGAGRRTLRILHRCTPPVPPGTCELHPGLRRNR